MPYASPDDLPAPVRKTLPEHAQEIFVAAFNSAYAEHHAGGEVTAFKIAWGAVKKSIKNTKADGFGKRRGQSSINSAERFHQLDNRRILRLLNSSVINCSASSISTTSCRVLS